MNYKHLNLSACGLLFIGLIIDYRGLGYLFLYEAGAVFFISAILNIYQNRHEII